MSSSKKEVHLKGKVARDQATSYLRDLEGCLSAGTVCVQNGAEALVLTPETQVELELKASQKGDKEVLSISVSWRKAESEEPSFGPLTISRDAPPEPSEPAEEEA